MRLFAIEFWVRVSFVLPVLKTEKKKVLKFFYIFSENCINNYTTLYTPCLAITKGSKLCIWTFHCTVQLVINAFIDSDKMNKLLVVLHWKVSWFHTVCCDKEKYVCEFCPFLSNPILYICMYRPGQPKWDSHSTMRVSFRLPRSVCEKPELFL